MIALIAVPVLAYLIGSFPTSMVAGRLAGGIDIRQHGSKNAGMTNILRVLGWKPAVVVGVVDILKGWVAAAYVPLVAANGFSPDADLLRTVAASGAILGHSYPIFGGFRGGKGVATLTGAMIGLFPSVLPFSLAAFVIALVLTGYVSVGSISGTVTVPLALLFLSSMGLGSWEPPVTVFSVIIPLWVIFTHRDNLKRLKEGSENRFERVRLFSRTD